MQGIKRKVVYATAYELLGILISGYGLALLSGSAPSHTGPLSLLITSVAVGWNMAYNYLFERWEARQAQRARSLRRRLAHALGFQLTLVLYLIPLIAWWLDITLWRALVLDLALMVVIPCYTLLFNWGFDLLFGQPASACPTAAQDQAENSAAY